MSNATCTVTNCEKPARSSSAALCKMHYHRWYRHGDVDKVATGSVVTASLGRRYKSKYRPSHPLATKFGNVYEHRMVLFDAIGPGLHACHWCGTDVEWVCKGQPRELQPDHLNGDGADNRLSNLVAACRTCNSARGSQARADALRAAGWWSGNDTVANLRGSSRSKRVGFIKNGQKRPVVVLLDNVRIGGDFLIGTEVDIEGETRWFVNGEVERVHMIDLLAVVRRQPMAMNWDLGSLEVL